MYVTSGLGLRFRNVRCCRDIDSYLEVWVAMWNAARTASRQYIYIYMYIGVYIYI